MQGHAPMVSSLRWSVGIAFLHQRRLRPGDVFDLPWLVAQTSFIGLMYPYNDDEGDQVDVILKRVDSSTFQQK